MELLPELHVFIVQFCKELEIKHVDLEALGLDTSLEIDLNLDEYEIDWFLEAFVKKFNIDYSGFNAEKRLYKKNQFILLDIVRWIFGYKMSWVKKLSKMYSPKLTVRDLQEAIQTGILL